MTTDVLVQALATGSPKKVAAAQRKIEANERRAAREAARRKRLLEAQFSLAAIKRDEEKAAKILQADAAEAALRAAGEPHVVIVYGGREFLIDLSQTEPVSAGTAQEAVRRIVYRVREAWRDQVTGTRNAGHVVAAKDFWPQIQTSSDGVLQAMNLGLVAARNTDNTETKS